MILVGDVNLIGLRSSKRDLTSVGIELNKCELLFIAIAVHVCSANYYLVPFYITNLSLFDSAASGSIIILKIINNI